MLKANTTQASQEVATTAEQGTQEAPAQTSAGSQTPQQYDISQGYVPMQTDPHVEDRRAQLLEQENEALLRQREQERMVAERQLRLLSEQDQHLASLTRRDEEREAEVRQMLTQVQQSELVQAARLASAESQAERVIQQQQRQHKQKKVEYIQRDANRRITGQGNHTTTPTATPQKDKAPHLQIKMTNGERIKFHS